VLRAFTGRVAIALVLCFAVVTAGVAAVNRYIDQEIDKIPKVDVTTDPVVDGHGVNYLIVGSDSRAFVEGGTDAQAFGDESKTGPPRSDTLMVLHADGDASYVVSFPRDLWVTVPGKGKEKINAAYNDGPQAVIDTMKSNFDIPINHYVEVNFVAFSKLVDSIGTIGVYFPLPTRDYDTQQLGDTGFLITSPGCVQLNGEAALQYVRSRHMQQLDPTTNKWVSTDPIPDIARIERQQAFVKKLGRVAVERLLADPQLAPDLVDGVIPELTADRGFDRSAANELVRTFMAVRDNGDAIQFDTLPWTGGTAGGQQVLFVKTPDADAVLAVLRGDQPIPAPTAAPPSSAGSGSATAPTLRPVDVRVKVLNASGVQGEAATASTAFSNLGFVNGGIGNDSRGTITTSEVRYKPGDDAKAQLVAAHVPGATLVADSTLPGTDVVVVLGKDFKSVSSATATTQPPSTPTTTLSPADACE
jgi:polyisoprenyl-teichoic acid--peptidoglycan teichoic acid transferase